MKEVFFIIYPFAVIILSLVLIAVTAFLSGRESPVPGAAAVIVSTVLFLVMNMVAVHQYGRAEITLLRQPVEEGLEARMYVRMDHQNQITAYGPLEIIGADGTLYDAESIYNDGDSLADAIWGDMFRKLTEGRVVKTKYPDEKSLVADSEKMIASSEAGQRYVGNITWLYLMPLTCAGLPMLAVYLLQRRRVNRRRQKEERRRLEIQSL